MVIRRWRCSGGDLRVYVPKCPDQYFGWRIYGVVKITSPGDYTFCTSSDDGSLLYMDTTPSDTTLSYSLLIDNDGLHGNRQYCRAVKLSTAAYKIKVSILRALVCLYYRSTGLCKNLFNIHTRAHTREIYCVNCSGNIITRIGV